MLFQIPGTMMVGVSAIGGRTPPPDDYYEPVISKIDTAKTAPGAVKEHKIRLTLLYPNGYDSWAWLTMPSAPIPAGKDPEKVQAGRLGAIRAVYESVGYNAEQIEQGNLTDEWLLNKTCRVAFVGRNPAQKNKKADDYYDEQDFLNIERFEAAKASGVKPTRSAPANQGAVMPGVAMPGVAMPGGAMPGAAAPGMPLPSAAAPMPQAAPAPATAPMPTAPAPMPQAAPVPQAAPMPQAAPVAGPPVPGVPSAFVGA
jgi:hypothetical protein